MMIIGQMHNLHVTVNTWWSSAKCTICMLQLIHDDHWPNAQFACYMYEYMMLVLFAQLHVMGLGKWYS